MKKEDLKKEEEVIENCLRGYLQTGKDHTRPYRDANAQIWDLIAGRTFREDADFDIHLNASGTAFERLKTELMKGLVHFDDWFTVEQDERGSVGEFMTPLEAKKLLKLALDSAETRLAVGEMIGSLLVENFAGLKLHGEVFKAPGQKSSWRNKWIPLCLDNYMRDPVQKDPIWEIYYTNVPKHILLKTPGLLHDEIKEYCDAGIDPEQADKDITGGDLYGDEYTARAKRHELTVYEVWGTIINQETGEIATYKGKELENVQVFCLENGELISEPVHNSRYSGRKPFFMTRLLRDGKSVYRPGLLSYIVEINQHLDTLISSLVKAALKSAHGVTLINEDSVKNKEALENGLRPETVLISNGRRVGQEPIVEHVSLGQVSRDAMGFVQMLQSMGPTNVMSSESQLYGVDTSNKTATAQQLGISAISGSFEHWDATIEDEVIELIAQETFHDALKNRKKFSDDDLMWVFSKDRERMELFKAMKEKAVLETMGSAFRFRGKGVRSTQMTRSKNQSYLNFLSAVFGNPVLSQVFMDTYSFKGFLAEFMRTLEIDPESLVHSEAEEALILIRKAIEMKTGQAMAMQEAGAPPAAQNTLPATGAPTDELA